MRRDTLAYLLHRANDQIEWSRKELPDTAVLLRTAADPAQGVVMTAVDDPFEVTDAPEALALIVPWTRAGRMCHAHFKLVEDTYRNAEPVPLSDVAVLRDRDCLLYRSNGVVHRIFYDAFTRPQVRPYASEPLDCAYCRQPVTPEMLAVECPSCGIIFHHADEDGCWLASERCPNCGHLTALDQEPGWIPQGFADRVQEVNDDAF
jgi:hypothetical protein